MKSETTNHQEDSVIIEESDNHKPTENGKDSTALNERLLELINPEPDEPERIEGLLIGTLVSVWKNGNMFVDYPDNPTGKSLAAKSTTTITREDKNKEVALMFESGDPNKPIIIGLMHQKVSTSKKASKNLDGKTQTQFEALVDGEKVTINAENEIELSCGDASITLTRAGKILIRGKYILSRSSGVNHIKGGSVQLN